MQIVTWFGRIGQESGPVRQAENIDAMIGDLLALDALDTDPAIIPPSQPDLRALAKECGFVADDKEYNARLREVALALVHRRLSSLVTAEQDLLQAVEALDNLNQAVNLLDERLYEWSRLRRQEIVHGKDLAQALCEDEATGILARTILSLRESRSSMEKEVIDAVQTIAPSLSGLAGPVLAARLISRSGSLHRLAELPSSSIQVMGAEKSLFKHLNGHAPSPKHGIIYRHPAVIGAPKKLRGKVSRALAGKLAIAARLDAYGGSPTPDIKADLDRRLADIRKRGRNAHRPKS
ncbi:MAG: NOP58 family protein [Methanothrix sp.]|nr:MAG: NOP58 family protein [Methanothrix sp.]